MKLQGIETFELTLLEEGLTKTEVSQRERYYIAKWNLCHDPFHYNLTEGGETGVFSEEAKKRLRRPKSDAHKCAIGAALAGRKGQRKHSEMTLQKLRVPKSEEHKKKIAEARQRYIATSKVEK